MRVVLCHNNTAIIYIKLYHKDTAIKAKYMYKTQFDLFETKQHDEIELMTVNWVRCSK